MTGHTKYESGPLVNLYPVSTIISGKEVLNKYSLNVICKLLSWNIVTHLPTSMWITYSESSQGSWFEKNRERHKA